MQLQCMQSSVAALAEVHKQHIVKSGVPMVHTLHETDCALCRDFDSTLKVYYLITQTSVPETELFVWLHKRLIKLHLSPSKTQWHYHNIVKGRASKRQLAMQEQALQKCPTQMQQTYGATGRRKETGICYHALGHQGLSCSMA